MPTELFAAIQDACARLPKGWTIHLHAEEGAAWVELEAPDLKTYKPDCPDDSLAEQIAQLVGYACVFTSLA